MTISLSSHLIKVQGSDFRLDAMTRVYSAILALSLVPLTVQAEPSDYTYTTERARQAVLEYCRSECARAVRRLPCCDMFEKAMHGDFSALTTVFTDADYHSGDNESWEDAAWPLLHAVGDKRFAAWLRTLDPKTQNQVFDHLFYSGSYHSRAIKEGYFRKKFPKVETIYRTLHRKDNPA